MKLVPYLTAIVVAVALWTLSYITREEGVPGEQMFFWLAVVQTVILLLPALTHPPTWRVILDVLSEMFN